MWINDTKKVQKQPQQLLLVLWLVKRTMLALDAPPESCLSRQSSGWALAHWCGQEMMKNWAARSLVLISPEPLCGQD